MATFTYRHPVIGINNDENSGRYGSENGWENRAATTIALNDATRTFTITPIAPAFYWTEGSRYELTHAESIQFDDTEGIKFFFFNGETLTTTPAIIEDMITKWALCAVAYWDATNKVSVIFGDERHGREMPSILHLYLHLTSGCQWASGLQPVEITHGNGNNAVDAQIGIEAGQIWDEDIRINLLADARPLAAPFLYRSGATGLWRKIDSTGYVSTIIGAGQRAAWNEWTGATWKLTEVATNDYVCMHLLATNDTRTPFMWVVGQADYLTLAAARTGADTEWQNLNTGQLELLMPEFVFIATFIIQTATGYGNAVKSKIVTLESGDSFVDLRKR
jgi:hypothetical protein